MIWTYQGRPSDPRPRDVRCRWRPRDLVCGELFQDLRTADLSIYDHYSPDLGVEHLESTLTKLCLDHRRRRLAKDKGTCYWTPGWNVKDRESVH